MWWTDGTPRPDHGPGWRNRTCATCSAGWVGHADDGLDWCPWCEAAHERQEAAERLLLLAPPWLASNHRHVRYDGLSEADRAVWDRTRGQSRHAGSVLAWLQRLERAVSVDLITQREAEHAIRRVHGTND
jgi:hypothetical protein